jgi:hypothetical protein
LSKLFRTKGWMTIAQLTGVWSSELAEGGEDLKQCEQNLVHILIEDIVNGRLDDSGPLRDDGQRLGLRLIRPNTNLASSRARNSMSSFRSINPGFYIMSW